MVTVSVLKCEDSTCAMCILKWIKWRSYGCQSWCSSAHWNAIETNHQPIPPPSLSPCSFYSLSFTAVELPSDNSISIFSLPFFSLLLFSTQPHFISFHFFLLLLSWIGTLQNNQKIYTTLLFIYIWWYTHTHTLLDAMDDVVVSLHFTSLPHHFVCVCSYRIVFRRCCYLCVCAVSEMCMW